MVEFIRGFFFFLWRFLITDSVSVVIGLFRFSIFYDSILVGWMFLEMYLLLLSILEKAMATHSSTLAWKIPWTEEPGEVPSMGSHRVGHDWSDLAAAAVAVSSFPYYYCIAVYFPFSPVNICFKNFGGLLLIFSFSTHFVCFHLKERS